MVAGRWPGGGLGGAGGALRRPERQQPATPCCLVCRALVTSYVTQGNLVTSWVAQMREQGQSARGTSPEPPSSASIWHLAHGTPQPLLWRVWGRARARVPVHPQPLLSSRTLTGSLNVATCL